MYLDNKENQLHVIIGLKHFLFLQICTKYSDYYYFLS